MNGQGAGISVDLAPKGGGVKPQVLASHIFGVWTRSVLWHAGRMMSGALLVLPHLNWALALGRAEVDFYGLWYTSANFWRQNDQLKGLDSLGQSYIILERTALDETELD